MTKNIYEEVANCNTVTELISVVKSIENLTFRSGKVASSLDMAIRIDEVMNGSPINLVTRNYGIRAKVCEFLFYKMLGWEY